MNQHSGRAAEGRAAFASGGSFKECLDTLEEADSLLLGMDSRDVAGFLLPPLAEMLGATRDGPSERHFDQYDCLSVMEFT